ncbi:hypothetical protein MMRN_p0440 (plasmid) [Mycobacterium marinum]|nr:hypothetical protein MMRN_p0440 [Mycobacterium marinum]
MNTSPIDQERDRIIAIYNATCEGFLADIYGADLGATEASHLEARDPAEVGFNPAAESGADDDKPSGPGVMPAEDAVGATASAEHRGAHRPADDPPVDLDAADSGEPMITHDADTNDQQRGACQRRNRTPGSDLVDQLTCNRRSRREPRRFQACPRYNKRIAVGFAAATVIAT